MIFEAIASIFSGVSKGAGDAISNWSERSTIKAKTKARIQEIKAESEVRVAEMEAEARKANALVKVEQARTGQQIDYNMDMEMIRQQKNSWKDEMLLILFSAQILASFVPHLQPYILKGWEMLGKAPDWFLWLYAGMVISVWGLRGIARSVLESKILKK
jgi:hypothetical protein